MTDLYDFFSGSAPPTTSEPYRKLGYPSNPFVPASGASIGEPFYADHITEPLQRLRAWVRGVHSDTSYLAASLVGNIGAGKTRILEQVSGGIRKWPANEKAFVHSVHLSQSGYSRASAGALLLGAFESAMDGVLSSSEPRSPGTGILPIVWAITHSASFPEHVEGQVAQALRRAREAKNPREKELLCEDVSLWLRRQALTPARVRASGLTRTIDWEGELIPILSDLLRFARECGLLRSLFLFVDQIEDLFTPSFTQVRRSRLLTDLRALVDQAEMGAPVGLLLAWAPESDDALAKKYEALANRLRRVRIELPLLAPEHAAGFASVWVKAMTGEPGFEQSMQPRIDELAGAAWSRLREQKVLLPPQRATPRELLRALAEEVDLRAGLRVT